MIQAAADPLQAPRIVAREAPAADPAATARLAVQAITTQVDVNKDQRAKRSRTWTPM